MNCPAFCVELSHNLSASSSVIQYKYLPETRSAACSEFYCETGSAFMPQMK